MSHNTYGRVVPLALALALGTALFVALGGSAARVLVTVPFVLVLPGLALTFAAFPAKRLDVPERLLFALGLSLVIVTVGGFALHMTPWSLRPASWAALLGMVALGAGVVAIVRWRGGERALASVATRDAPATPAAPAATWRLSRAQAAQCTLAVLILASAVTLTIRGAQGQSTIGFTQLWMVEQITPDARIVQLGVRNDEPAATAFRLQLEVNQRVRRTWALTLVPGQAWTEAITLPAELSDLATIEAVLYRDESPGTVYRRVQIQRGQR